MQGVLGETACASIAPDPHSRYYKLGSVVYGTGVIGGLGIADRACFHNPGDRNDPTPIGRISLLDGNSFYYAERDRV